ncbi:hypothetical protein Vafri_8789 [Volvox africanus]|uniref:Uncharacterized protein n=1 Tax=Volvox africanus TaxID=51714 RepID=A0A8J4B323_9CHLO|nr:hypothetical protein Vafri_8789 [Volvox africanus]
MATRSAVTICKAPSTSLHPRSLPRLHRHSHDRRLILLVVSRFSNRSGLQTSLYPYRHCPALPLIRLGPQTATDALAESSASAATTAFVIVSDTAASTAPRRRDVDLHRGVHTQHLITCFLTPQHRVPSLLAAPLLRALPP